MKPEITENIDQYCNICRDWRIQKDGFFDELLIVHSGTDGTSIATRSSNNNFIRLTEEEIRYLIKELQDSIQYNKDSKNRQNSFWSHKNAAYDIIKKR